MENTNLYKLVNACIDHGPGWAHPGSRKLGRKLSSLTGPKLWDIVGLRKMKRAPMRSSMRAAQGPWPTRRKQPRNRSALGAMDPGHHFSLQAFEPTHAGFKPASQGFKLQARGHKLQDPVTRVQAHKLRVRGTSNKDK